MQDRLTLVISTTLTSANISACQPLTSGSMIGLYVYFQIKVKDLKCVIRAPNEKWVDML